MASGELTCEGYSNKFVENIDAFDFDCAFCCMVVRDAMQVSACGHLFCSTCWSVWMKINRSSKRKLHCPVDKKVIDPSQVFHDRKQDRLVRGLKVYCDNKDCGCDITPELRDLETHLVKCEYQSVYCELECGVIVIKALMEDHKKNECPRRMVTCDACDSHIQHQNLQRHENECPSKLVGCQETNNLMGITMMITERIDRIEGNNRAKDVTVEGRFDKQNNEISKLSSVTRALTERINDVERNCDVEKEINAKLMAFDKENVAPNPANRGDKRNKEKEKCEWVLNERWSIQLKSVTARLAELEKRNDDQKTTCEKLMIDNATLASTLDTMKKTANIGAVLEGASYSCPFKWRIELLKGMAKKESPAFYAHNGYKMKFVVQVLSSGSEFYVGVALIESEYSGLTWPWKDFETFSITDSNGCDIVEFIAERKDGIARQQPSSDVAKHFLFSKQIVLGSEDSTVVYLKMG